MKRILLPLQSFIAYVDYNDKEELYITMKKTGKQYLYKNVPAQEFTKIQNATNKGSHISIHILNNKKYKGKGEFVGNVPLADVELITMPVTKFYRTNLAR